MLQNQLFDQVLKDFNTPYWVISSEMGNEEWSSSFLESLGYTSDPATQNFTYFLDHMLHPEDREVFYDKYKTYHAEGAEFKHYVRIKNYRGTYKLFRISTREELPIDIQSDVKLLFFFEVMIEKAAESLRKDNFYYKETAEMTATGSWYVDFVNKKSYWDFETRRILEYPEDYVPSLSQSASYYASAYRQQAADLFFNCAVAGKRFDTEIKMLTATEREFWVRAIGKPVYNEQKEIIGIRGVFQDIDDQKEKELGLRQSIEIIENQNSRLSNFAHIVSHNLRSHSSNLSLLVQLIETIDDQEEKVNLIDDIKDISTSLNTTIEHLNEIVTIHTNAGQKLESVSFRKTLDTIQGSIRHIIASGQTKIETDFQVKEIQYVPAYLESIFLNLITNAIKYKHPDRDAKVCIRTYTKKGVTILEVSDNGQGIDLNQFGDKVFGMYKTFHYNKDAVGIGLFMTRNQIESLGGTIRIESEVNKGTKFTITFDKSKENIKDKTE